MNAVLRRTSVLPSFLQRWYCAQTSTTESVEKLRARLLYQSRKRGMLENDLLLSTFAKQNLDKFNESQLRSYDELINRSTTNDWDLYYWFVGRVEAPEEVKRCEIFQKLAEHAKNIKKEQRLRMPAL